MIGSSQPSAESGAVYALLAAIADPKKAKARLDEIEKARSALEEVQEKNRLTLVEIRNTTEVNVNALAASDKALAERRANIDNQQNALNLATADLRRSEQTLADQRAQFNKTTIEAGEKLATLSEELGKRETGLNARELELKAFEDQVFIRDQKAQTALREANAIKADYERRAAVLQEALKK